MDVPQVAEFERLGAMYAARVAAHDAEFPGYARLFARFAGLVCAPGQLVVPPLAADPLVAVLPDHGRRLEGRTRSAEGEPSQCHANACLLWLAGEVDSVVTGYALSGDGLWRQHSAGWDFDGTVVETTEARDAYFAGRLSDVGTWVFAAAALSPAEAAAVLCPERAGGLGRMLDALDSGSYAASPDAALVALGDEAWLPW